MSEKKKCFVDNCSNASRSRGLCPKHYSSFMRYGYTEAPVRKGITSHYLYRTWVMMQTRCNYKKYYNYKNYGGRGITICDRWDNFWNFVEDMGKRPSKEWSLDRIDNDGNYEPSNCRWVTRKDQARNRRNNVITQKIADKIIAKISLGITLRDISNDMSISYDVVRNIKYKGHWR